MKKRILISAVILVVAVLMTGCGNKDYFDTTYKFDKAIIYMHGEVMTVEVAKWTDYDDGEQIQITAKDGTVYLTSSYNCTLIKTPR